MLCNYPRSFYINKLGNTESNPNYWVTSSGFLFQVKFTPPLEKPIGVPLVF